MPREAGRTSCGKKDKDHRRQAFRLQAMASNASGRHRTMDHLLPLQPADDARPKPKGRELGRSGRLRRC